MASPRATVSGTLCRLAVLLILAAWRSPCGAADLFRDDFSSFPPGWLTRPVGQLNAAIQEYHYLPHRGVPLGPWANAICHLDAWAAGEEDGKAYLEQHTVNDQSRLMNPIFLTGVPEWESYTVEVGVRPLSKDDMAGVVFRYHTNRSRIDARVAGREAELAGLRDRNPRPKVWKTFKTPKFGAGRNVRLGDLDGDGTPEILIAQNIPRIGDNFMQISCLTAVTLDGRVLWQLGRPDPKNGLLTADTPFQIHDIDGDGRNEVVMLKDFKLQVLEGHTGRVRKWVWMPRALPDNGKKPFTLTNGDSLAFLNLSGGTGRRELLVKDRYSNFWTFDSGLAQLWLGQGQTGHFPYPFDIDGDGRDEVAIGYALWDHRGHRIWSHDAELEDHADGVAVGNFSGDPRAEPRFYAWGSDEGFLMFDRRGTIMKHVRIGHAQTASVGKYLPDRTGLQLMCINFWKNPGIISLFDHDGNLLGQQEPIHSGSSMLPVNWRGDGQEFVLLSGNAHEGGMIDGKMRRVVMFPDDGHPDLAAYVADVTGDARDEVILWDQERVWIYTQDRPFPGKRVYSPTRNPGYNESNYRTVVSLPGWAGAR
ncbi:MAG: hypothetical protein ACHRXM_09630 [Isosphaerales bacterium]